MDYSPKLKKAMEEVKAVLKKHDIAAFVVLHTPGFTEYLNAVSPSYSCAKIAPDGIQVTLKEAEVGRAKAKQLADGTYNMVACMADVVGMHAMMYLQAEKHLQKHWNGESFPGSHTSHEQQNN